ncbi:MAG: hypothetical protein JWN25_1407 [Verrucomicrobiales bacterium]|nr:hypothetical protein [Verrucomicrobiales bacterium]
MPMLEKEALLPCKYCKTPILPNTYRCPQCRHRQHKSAFSFLSRWRRTWLSSSNLLKFTMFLGAVLLVIYFVNRSGTAQPPSPAPDLDN